MNASIRVNGKDVDLTEETVADLLLSRGIVKSRGVAVAVNGTVVPSGTWRDLRLNPGDQIEIVRPFGGG